MDASGSTRHLFECDECGNLGVGSPGIVCCGSEMVVAGVDAEAAGLTRTQPESASADAMPADAMPAGPDLDDLLRFVFGMSPAELDVCLCVMEGGTTTVAELTERVGYDRSVVSRHLNHLATLGVVEKRRQLLDRGGDVYVYSPNAPETVRRRFRQSFLWWVATAADRIDDLSREKVAAITESESATEWTVFREA